MPLNTLQSLAIIITVALVVFTTRATPFLIFKKGKAIPKTINYLGKVLTPAIIALLVVYCLRNTTVFSYPHGIPEFIAVIATVVLHVWKRNNLLSIGGGTVLYMVLIHIM
ncbi:MAG: AzlD domain-containing protein [Lachnospiraceae bacterium]|jgi:branched-subunit amino acid transport protein AzlD|nr:AzlD domain-containing protein [Lachnospiraceae bacterium]